MLFRLLALFSLFALASCSSGSSSRIDSLSARTSGTTLSYALKGEGRPSVIFESGLGDRHQVWSDVINSISLYSKVYAYNRNQASQESEASFATIRNSEHIAIALRTKLRAAKVEPPFVLVGHSYGGLYMLKFAQLFKKEVAGVVLIDSRPVDFTNDCKTLKLGNCELPFFVRSLMAPNEKQEIRGITDTENNTPTAAQLKSLPITVMTATVPEPGYSTKYQEHWIRLQKRFASELTQGRFVSALGSRSKIHEHRPDLVIAEIRAMIEKVK